MSEAATALPLPAVPPEVVAFAAERGAAEFLPTVVGLARSAFPNQPLAVFLEEDAETAGVWRIIIEVLTDGLDANQILAGEETWSAELVATCPGPQSVWFVLGFR
jgi:hypothetical protein